MRVRLPQRIIGCLTSGTMLATLLLPAIAAGAEPQSVFTDIAASYASHEITELANAGILAGYQDGSFQPAKAITRAELAKILVVSKGLKETPEQAAAFQDVQPDSWYRGYVGALVASGITQGTSEHTFSPEAQVTREELVVFFVRSLGLEQEAKQFSEAGLFSDEIDIAEWAQPAVKLSAKIGFINGLEGADGKLTFKPKQQADRQALARLAYEFKVNQADYTAKGKKLVNELNQPGSKASEIKSVKSASSTSIEVTFASPIEGLSKEHFSFEPELKVTTAAFQTGSKTVVILTTETQSAGKEYKLSYKGEATKHSVTGASSFFGGGGGGGGSTGNNGSTNTQGVKELLASGKPQTSLTITKDGEYGPAAGSVTTVKELTVDPGVNGKVILKNINPEQLIVLSGGVNSIVLKNTAVNQLKVNAIHNQGKEVRIEAQSGAIIASTEVLSQAILEASSSEASLGSIILKPSAAGKSVTLRGLVDSDVTVEAPDVKLKAEPPTTGSSVSGTVVKSLVVKANTQLITDNAAIWRIIRIAAPKTKLQLTGTGKIEQVHVTRDASDSELILDSGVQLSTLKGEAPVQIKANAEDIDKVVFEGNQIKIEFDPVIVAEFKNKAIQRLTDLFSKLNNYGYDELVDHLKIADLALEAAKKWGVTQQDFEPWSLEGYQRAKKAYEVMTYAWNETKITYQEGDSADSVTKRPVLANGSQQDYTVIWNSSRSDLISGWGEFTRPASGAGDAVVTLEAIIYYGWYNVSKTFVITIKQYDAKVQRLDSLRPDLVAVEFDSPLAGPVVNDFVFDQNLSVQSVTYYPQFPKIVLLTVDGQKQDTIYKFIYKGGTTDKTLTGSLRNLCSNSTCPLPSGSGNIPIPGVWVNGSLEGYVWDRIGQKVSGADVVLDGTNLKTQTDAWGYYRFNDVPSGKAYTVTASKEGYSKETSPSFILGSGEPRQLFLHLKEKPRLMKDFQVYFVSYNSFMFRTEWVGGYPDQVKVFSNGQWMTSINGFNDKIESLKPATTYQFTFQACNAAGCSSEEQREVTTKAWLGFEPPIPYNSVTQAVYAPLVKRTDTEEKYILPKSAQGADTILLKLKDLSDHQVNLQNAVDYSDVVIGRIPGDNLTGHKLNLNGQSYLAIPLDKTGLTNRAYWIAGLKYRLAGKLYDVEFMDYSLDFE
ncbi:S-layer homology domain-containing protein [Paenibacillus filicis]|uniref:S-layer homology domain-containing protein n=1 Tax=Paenibacillus filicis TaxID=669464 RepID=A0ABU9DQH6_9BACL